MKKNYIFYAIALCVLSFICGSIPAIYDEAQRHEEGWVSACCESEEFDSLKDVVIAKREMSNIEDLRFSAYYPGDHDPINELGLALFVAHVTDSASAYRWAYECVKESKNDFLATATRDSRELAKQLLTEAATKGDTTATSELESWKSLKTDNLQ